MPVRRRELRRRPIRRRADAGLFERLDADQERPDLCQRSFVGTASGCSPGCCAAATPTATRRFLATSSSPRSCPAGRKSPSKRSNRHISAGRAVRYLLLTMDTNGNSSIEADEVPEDLQPAVRRVMADRIDTNKNDVLDRQSSLSRGGRPLGTDRRPLCAAKRYRRRGRAQEAGRKTGRRGRPFDGPAIAAGKPGAIPNRLASFFASSMATATARSKSRKCRSRCNDRLSGCCGTADRDRDGRLSEREFLTGTRRIAARAAGIGRRDAGAKRCRPKQPVTVIGRRACGRLSSRCQRRR